MVGVGLSVLLFNIGLEWIVRKLIRPEDMRRTALVVNRAGQSKNIEFSIIVYSKVEALKF